MHVDTTSDYTLANFLSKKRISPSNNILLEEHIIYKISKKKKEEKINNQKDNFQIHELHTTIPYHNSTFHTWKKKSWTFWKFSKRAKQKTRFTKFLKNKITKKKKKKG